MTISNEKVRREAEYLRAVHGEFECGVCILDAILGNRLCDQDAYPATVLAVAPSGRKETLCATHAADPQMIWFQQAWVVRPFTDADYVNF